MRQIALLLVIGILSGCAATDGNRTVVHSVTKPPHSILNSVRSPFPMVVLGRPPDGSDAQTVAAALRLPQRQGGGGFVLTAPDSEAPRIVVSFSAASLRALCRETSPADTPSGSLTMSAGLCRGTEGLSYGILTAGGVVGPTDPGFEPAVSILLRQILTPKRSSNSPR